ncbi:hypothetical protein D9M68_604180 [compost metagenome]
MHRLNFPAETTHEHTRAPHTDPRNEGAQPAAGAALSHGADRARHCHDAGGQRRTGARCPGPAGLQRRLVRQQERGAEHCLGDGPPAQRHAGIDADQPAGAAQGRRTVAALHGQPEHGGAFHCRATGGAGGRTRGRVERRLGHPRRPGRRRAQGRHPQPHRRLAQCQGAGADGGGRPHRGRHRADRRQGDPELGELQRREAHHGAVRPEGRRQARRHQRMDRTQPHQRPERPTQPDRGADQGRRLGVPHQPQRHRLHGVEPGGHALAGGIEPFAVGQAVQAGHQQPAGALQPGQRFPDSAVRRVHVRQARDLWRQRLQARRRRRARPHGQRRPFRSRRGARRGQG